MSDDRLLRELKRANKIARHDFFMTHYRGPLAWILTFAIILYIVARLSS